MKKITIGALVGILLVGGAASIFGYRAYAHSSELNSIKPAVNLTTAYLSQVLQANTKPGSMTYAEFFAKTSEAISEIDKKEIEVKSLEIKYASDERAIALSYMSGAQEVIRNEASMYHNRSSIQSDFSEADEAISDMSAATKSRNEYSYQYASERATKALERAKKGTADLEDSRQSLLTALKNVRSESVTAISAFGVRDSPVSDIDAAAKINQEKPHPAANTSPPPKH